jgi:hypothetical protein
MKISQEKLDEFQARMSNWVASQGFIFQLTHGGGVKGAHSTLFLWMGRMAVRLLILIAVAAVIFWGYLIKRVDFGWFRSELNVSIADALGADDATAGGIDRSRGHLEISQMELAGGEESFFETAEIRGLRTRMGLFDGVLTDWNGETITITKLDIGIRAGAEENELGTRTYQRLFQESDKFKFSRLDITDATIRWGYSPVTRGFIKNAEIRARRKDGGWHLEVTGGLFRQNWLQDLEIVRMEIAVLPDGIEIREAKFKRGQGEVNLTARLEGPATHPTLKGSGSMRAVSIDACVGAEVREFVGGEISGTFELGGSPYASGGVTVTAELTLEAEDQIELLDRPNLFKAISVVDRHRSYKTVRFRTGRFKLKTGGGQAVFSDIWLYAKDVMRVEGAFLARPPTEQEIKDALQFEQTGVRLERSAVEPAEEEEELPDEGESKEFSLEEVAREAREKTDVEEKINTIFQSEVFGVRLNDEAWRRQLRVPILEGVLRLGLHAKAFERSEELDAMYPVDKESGLRWLEVPLHGSIYDAGASMAEEIYLRSRPKRRQTVPPSR